MTQIKLDQFDGWLAEEGPVALMTREYLLPVDGPDGVVFPPTFAAAEGQASGGYNIDDIGSTQTPRKVALIDSVGSQANRLEPLFKRVDLRELVPQITIKAGAQNVNLLDAGHRAGDAIVRYTSIGQEVSTAFTDWQKKGSAVKLAKIAPTSLIFGAWDSRDTQAKLPRLFASTIRAYGVKPLKRSAQYNPAVDYLDENLVEAKDKKDLDTMSGLGFRHAPAAGSHGGVIVEEQIRRDTLLNLVGLRNLGGDDEKGTKSLQRYVLGLGLVAFCAPRTHNLRQGCLLVPDPKNAATTEEVGRDGKHTRVSLDFATALAFAKLAAAEFGVGASREVAFDSRQAAAAIKEKKEKKG